MSHLDELETLHNLKEKGIISEEDFEKKKAELLNNQTTPPQGNTSQLAYVLLAFFLGALGIHNFYAGRWKRGLVQLLLTLLTFGIGTLITAPWSIINIFTIHTNGKGEEMIPCKTAKYIFGIIGILYWLTIPFIMTVGGIYGYKNAMTNYSANELLNYTSQIQVLAIASNNGMGISYTQNCQELMPAVHEANFFDNCTVAPGGQVNLSGVDKPVEDRILRQNPRAYKSNGWIVIPSSF